MVLKCQFKVSFCHYLHNFGMNYERKGNHNNYYCFAFLLKLISPNIMT